MRLLVSWIGNADVRAAEADDKSDIGPVAQAIEARQFDRVLLLADQERSKLRSYEGWLRARGQVKSRAAIKIERVELTSPTNFDEIYSAVTGALDRYLKELGERPELTFHLSPGTPAMAAIWVILGKTRYRAELIQSSRQQGVETASIPFEISLAPEFVTDVLRIPDRQLERLSAGASEDAFRFGDIIYRGQAMERLVARAKKAAPRSVPILIEGEFWDRQRASCSRHSSSERSERQSVSGSQLWRYQDIAINKTLWQFAQGQRPRAVAHGHGHGQDLHRLPAGLEAAQRQGAQARACAVPDRPQQPQGSGLPRLLRLLGV